MRKKWRNFEFKRMLLIIHRSLLETKTDFLNIFYNGIREVRKKFILSAKVRLRSKEFL